MASRRKRNPHFLLYFEVFLVSTEHLWSFSSLDKCDQSHWNQSYLALVIVYLLHVEFWTSRRLCSGGTTEKRNAHFLLYTRFSTSVPNICGHCLVLIYLWSVIEINNTWNLWLFISCMLSSGPQGDYVLGTSEVNVSTLGSLNITVWWPSYQAM